MPMLPTSVRITRGDELAVDQEPTAPLDCEDEEQRQRGACVGQDERVYGRGDVVSADVHGAAEELDGVEERVRVAQLEHRRCLGDSHVVEHAEGTDDDGAEQQPARRDAPSPRIRRVAASSEATPVRWAASIATAASTAVTMRLTAVPASATASCG